MLPTLSMFSTRRNTTAFVTRFFTSSWLTDITQWPGKIQRRITSRSTVASRYHTRCHCAMMIRLFTIWHQLSTKLYVVNMNISMVFNFTNKSQFATRISMENSTTEVINETKLLGVIINNKLDWDSNTQFLVKKANARMRLLHKLVDFSIPRDDLKTIYILYIRSHLEQSCQTEAGSDPAPHC